MIIYQNVSAFLLLCLLPYGFLPSGNFCLLEKRYTFSISCNLLVRGNFYPLLNISCDVHLSFRWFISLFKISLKTPLDLQWCLCWLHWVAQVLILSTWIIQLSVTLLCLSSSAKKSSQHPICSKLPDVTGSQQAAVCSQLHGNLTPGLFRHRSVRRKYHWPLCTSLQYREQLCIRQRDFSLFAFSRESETPVPAVYSRTPARARYIRNVPADLFILLSRYSGFWSLCWRREYFTLYYLLDIFSPFLKQISKIFHFLRFAQFSWYSFDGCYYVLLPLTFVLLCTFPRREYFALYYLLDIFLPKINLNHEICQISAFCIIINVVFMTFLLGENLPLYIYMYILRGVSCTFLRNTAKRVVLSKNFDRFRALSVLFCGCHNRLTTASVAGVAPVTAVFNNREARHFCFVFLCYSVLFFYLLWHWKKALHLLGQKKPKCKAFF